MRHAHSLLLGSVAAAFFTSASLASDFLADSAGGYSLYDFEGFYLGGTLGGAALPVTGLVGSAGVVVGANFALTDAFVSGAEFQGDLLLDGGVTGYNALLLGKLGGYLTDDVLAYGTAGGGFVDGAGSYAFGAGVEKAFTQQLSVRGEAMGTGNWGAGPSGAKATIGVLWYMN